MYSTNLISLVVIFSDNTYFFYGILYIKDPMALKIHFLRFSNVNMSSPSLPLHPQ